MRELRRQAEATSSDYDREKLKERVAKLAGGVALLRVRKAIAAATVANADQAAGLRILLCAVEEPLR